VAFVALLGLALVPFVAAVDRLLSNKRLVYEDAAAESPGFVLPLKTVSNTLCTTLISVFLLMFLTLLQKSSLLCVFEGRLQKPAHIHFSCMFVQELCACLLGFFCVPMCMEERG